MYRCLSCATAFVAPSPDADELNEFYRVFHLPIDQGGEYDLIESRMQADFPAKVQLIQSLGKVERLLDVGCGKGFFVRACLDAGIDATGIDISPTAVDYARNRLNVPAHCGRIEDKNLSIGKFDTITLWATIEHLPNPAATLASIRERLNSDGLLHLDTGVGFDWLDRALPGRVQWYDPPQHLFVFSEAGLTLALKQAGFAVVRYDAAFDRSWYRRRLRFVRAILAASALRATAILTRLPTADDTFTRFALGNLQSLSARRI